VSGNVLTVTSSVTGVPLSVGQTIMRTGGRAGLPAQTRIASFGTGAGGAGTYYLTKSVRPSSGSISMQGFIPWVVEWSGSVTMGIQVSSDNALASANQVAIGSNRVEINCSASIFSPTTFMLSLTAGGSTATVSRLTSPNSIFPF